MEGVLGERGRLALTAIALVATSNTVLLLLVSVSRSIYGMAQAGALPRPLGWIDARRTPWLSIAVVWVLASLFLLMGDISLVAQIANFATLVAFGMVNLSLAVLVRRERAKPAGSGQPCRSASFSLCWRLPPVPGSWCAPGGSPWRLALLLRSSGSF